MTPISAEQLNDTLVSQDWPFFEDVAVVPQLDPLSDKQTINYQITIQPELSYLAGHFPEQPVVPGVVQVHWVGELSKRFFACEGFSALKKVKFSNPILPTTCLELSLSYTKSNKAVNFVYSDKQHAYSSGVVSFNG